MGKRRAGRKSTLSRVNSESNLNGDDISSDAESESSLTVHEARSETFHTGVTNYAQTEQTLTQNRFSPIEEGDRFEPELGPSSERDEAPIASPRTNPQSKLHPVGSGDEPLRPPNPDESQMSFLLQALVRQIGQQGESHTKAITECMTGTVTMLKDTCESVKECVKSVADSTQLNFQQFASSTHNSFEQLASSTQNSFHQILAEVRDMRKERLSFPTTLGTTQAFQSGPITSFNSTSGQAAVTSLDANAISTTVTAPISVCASISKSGPCYTSALNTANVAQRSARIASHPHCEPLSTVDSTQFITAPSTSYIPDVQISTTNSQSNGTCAKHQNVRLPPFAGKSNDSWKVWHARFTTVANLNKWDETTRLSELMQRLQGPAAEFVFDEIPSAILTDYQSLVVELDSRFKSVETSRTFKVQFSKRVQKFYESVEDFAAELKRLYDKAYPGRNPEMRRQLLLQQFLNGLSDKRAKFAVEYYKEPNSIEDAIHHVVTYLEAQQAPKIDNWGHRNPHTKTVRFDNDDEEAYDSYDDDYIPTARARSVSPLPQKLYRQTLRKVNNNNPSDKSLREPTSTPDKEEKDILQKILSFMENTGSDPQPVKLSQAPAIRGQSPSPTPRGRQPNQRGQGYGQGQVQSPSQGQGHNYGQSWRQGQNQGQQHSQGQGHDQGQGRYANFQCYHCMEQGHIKRNCPVLLEESTRGLPSRPNRNRRPSPIVPYHGQPHAYPNHIDLN